MKKILLGTSLFFAVAVLGFAQQKPPAKGGTPKPPAAVALQQKETVPQVSENFVIGLEDVLQINVWKEPDFSVQSVVVRPDGKITLPVIGDIQANGLTTKQLQDSYIDRLRTYVKDPTVTVIVVKIESQKVSIVGAVGKPGAYPMGAPMTVLELIAKAGGLTDYAKATRIKILRKKDGRLLLFNYKDAINGRNLKQNVILENGDMVLVP